MAEDRIRIESYDMNEGKPAVSHTLRHEDEGHWLYTQLAGREGRGSRKEAQAGFRSEVQLLMV